MASKLKLLIGTAFAAICVAGAISLEPKKMNALRVAYDLDQPISTLDPSRIDNLSEAMLLRNLFSSLFEYDDENNLVTGIVDQFYWKKGSLHLSLKKAPLVSSGRPISTKDVYLSLMRLMIHDENRHGDLKNIICPGVSISKIAEGCKGLEINSDEVILTPASEELGLNLIPLLATVDYRVIPAEALKSGSPKIEIEKFDITSGPYYLDNQSDGILKLKANKYHYSYSADMPQEVELIRVGRSEAINAFARSEIDLIPSTVSFTQPELEKLKDSVPELSIAKTLNLKVSLIGFSKKAMQDFTVEERFAIGNLINDQISGIRTAFESPTIEFFQSLASGYLNEEQRTKINRARQSRMLNLPRKAIIGTTKRGLMFWEQFVRNHPAFEVKVYSVAPFELPIEERPDVFVFNNDVAFNRSSSVIAYNLNNGYLGKFGEDAKHWLSNYLKIKNPEESANALNELHFSALSSCGIFPNSVAPYVVLARNGWKANINPYFSSTELWLIRRN